MANHWYDREGKPRYKINKVGSKELRDTTLADAKKFNYVPSVTTVMGLISKPALVNWVAKETASAALANAVKAPWEDDEQHISRILRLSREKTEIAAKRGTEIHDKLENYYCTGKIDPADEKIIVPVLNLLAFEFNGQKWVAEESFGCKDGFGGKVDLHAKSGYIIDFKTKAKDTIDEKVIYDEYGMQLAAYRLGLALPNAKCYNLIISTTKPGTLLLYKWDEEKLKKQLQMFQLLLAYWKLQANYDSGWTDE